MESCKGADEKPRRSRFLTWGVVVLAVICLFFLVAFTITLVAFENLKNKTTRPPWLGPGPSDSPLERYLFTAVSTDSDVCGAVGTYMMVMKKGSAVDAAIATQLCGGLTNMQSAGIAGGSFMLVYQKKKRRVTAIDFRDVAPLNATAMMYAKNPKLSLKGGLAVSVPAELAGYRDAWERFGRLPWSELFEPVITMCEEGFRIPCELAKRIKNYEKDIRNSPGLRDLFVNKTTGALLGLGDVVRNPQLGQTFRIIANDSEAFYTGHLAEDIAKEVQDAGGILTVEDLEKYRPTNPEVVRAVLPNSKFIVYGLRPPSSGVLLTFMLRVIDGYKFGPEFKKSPAHFGLFCHRLVETFKFAYAKRSALGDENFMRANISEMMKNLTSQSYADHIRSLISDDRTHDVSYYGPSFQWREDEGTSHLSLVSPDGDAVAMTSSINTMFGSKVRGLKTGIIYNNGMDDFSTPNTSNTYGLPASPFNYIEPGKRPMSSMSPTIVTYQNGSVALVVGASGGSQITTRIAYVASRVLFLGETIKEAIDAPRLHHQLLPNKVKVDDNFPAVVIDILKSKGHQIITGPISVTQGIHIKGNHIFANADFRKGGKPSGQ